VLTTSARQNTYDVFGKGGKTALLLVVELYILLSATQKLNFLNFVNKSHKASALRRCVVNALGWDVVQNILVFINRCATLSNFQCYMKRCDWHEVLCYWLGLFK
jgi:hypothetical protein